MKIIFEEQEIDALPDDAREKLGDDLEIEVATISEFADTFEDVSGLKKALARERVGRREAEHDLKGTRKRLDDHDPDALAERDGEIESLKTQLGERDATIAERDSTIKTTSQDAKISEAVSKHKGDLDLLRPHLRARLDENPDADLSEIMPSLKEKHPGAFAASDHSGGGSPPTRGSDVHNLGPSAMPMRRSEMSDKQKNEYQKEHGLDALLDLPT